MCIRTATGPVISGEEDISSEQDASSAKKRANPSSVGTAFWSFVWRCFGSFLRISGRVTLAGKVVCVCQRIAERLCGQ